MNDAIKSIIDPISIPEVLNYGFLGLSVILVILVFLQFNLLIKQDKPDPIKLKAAKFYTLSLIAVMIIGGILKLTEGMLQKQDVPTENKLLVKVVPWTKNHPQKYGEIRIIQRTEASSVGDDTGVELKVGQDPEVQIQIQNLIDLIERKTKELELVREQVTDSVIDQGKDDAIAEPAAPIL